MPWDILGHEWAVHLLQQHIAQDRLRHAYLITGPRGVGRRTLALRLAQAVNCLTPQSKGIPCGVCSACERIGRMQHPDLAVIQAETVGGVLKVEEIRELQHRLSLSPYEAGYRVALLLRFEEANPSAANALLKTLEEPPPKVILILTAESAEQLLPTISSRCEILRLKGLPLKVIEEGLKTRWGIDPEQARLLAHLSGGRPGYAIQLHQQPEMLEQRRAWLDDHIRLLSVGRVDRFDFAEKLSQDKDAVRQALEVWLSLWRDILLRTAGAEAPLINYDRIPEIESLSKKLDLAHVRKTVAALEKTLDRISRNVNTRLAIEVLLLDLPRIP